MATPQQEKRSSPRHHAKLPAKLHTPESHELVETRDLSQSGIFLECATKVAEGSAVDIVMILPKEITGDVSKWVCCKATVKRVEENVAGNRYGVAAVVDRIQAMPELTWPDVDRRIAPIRSRDRRKIARAEGHDRRTTERRKS
jgi:hypothetical protein